jgi:hypothetical protein
MGSVITTLRAAGVASSRVRGGEPAPGDAKGPGEYQRFVVLSNLGRQRLQQAPVQEVRIGYRAYGATFQDAADLSGDISDALHLIGGRSASSGWIYESLEETGGAATKDPDTKQPYESGVIVLIATA